MHLKNLSLLFILVFLFFSYSSVAQNDVPEAYCQDIVIELDANGEAFISPEQVDGGTYFNDQSGILEIDTDYFHCSHVGSNAVTLHATNGLGNTSSCTAIVTVLDNTPPVISSLPIDVTVFVNEEETGSVESWEELTVTDNCGMASLVSSHQSDDFFPIGVHEVVFTATDYSGNVSIESFTISVIPSEALTLECQDLTLQLDHEGLASIVPEYLMDGTLFNSDAGDLVASQTEFDCSNLGYNLVSLTAVDFEGNFSTCTSDLWVEDVTSPAGIVEDIALEPNENGTAVIPTAEFFNLEFSDNCSS